MTKLNTDQQAAADTFAKFLHTKDPYFFISGPAGVGKTFLMDYLSNRGLQDYYDSCTLLGMKPEFDSVAFTATTNKAAEVLERSIGKPTKTIHSFLNLKVKPNYKTGKDDIQKTTSWKTQSRMVVFIDECSMIDSTLFAFLQETLVKCKVVFVGDHNQLAPVGEELSLIYGSMSQASFCELFEPVRNAGSPELMALCDQLRETVKTGIFRPITLTPGVVDYLNDDSMTDALDDVFQDLYPDARVLAYTNERVNMFNHHIRTQVRGLPVTFGPGDEVVVASAFASGKNILSVERELVINQVSSPKLDNTYVGILGGNPISYHEVSFKGRDIDEVGNPITFKVAVDRSDVDTLMRMAARQKDWTTYYELKETYLHIRDKAACTVYKAQGSTYDTVFVDLGNIGTSFDAQQVARMLYVGVSRARKRVVFYGDLPSRYICSQGKPLWIPKSGPIGSPSASSNVTAPA